MKRCFVIIPVHKADKYLEECLSAIGSQAMPDGWVYGIFLGVDSCKPSLDEIRRLGYLKPDGVYVFWSDINVGSYVMRNSLVRILPEPRENDILVFADADDIARPGYLFRCITALQRNPDVRAVRTLCRAFNDSNGQHRIPEHNRGFADGGFAVYRSTFEEMGGFQSWRHCADTEFHYRLDACGHATMLLPFVCVDYRIHGDNESSRNAEDLKLLKLHEQERSVLLEAGKVFPRAPFSTTKLVEVRDE